MQIELLDLGGTVLAGPFVLAGDKSDSVTFVTNEGFPRGRTFRLRYTEREVVGRYRLSILQPWGVTFGQRYLAAVVVLTVGLVITAGLGILGVGGAGMRRIRAVCGFFVFLTTFWLVYPVVHEAGHALALRAFDAWDPAGTQMLPFGGQLPHVSGKPSAQLAPWQTAVAAIAGPLLPTLLGYVSFALWVSRFGRRWRSQRLRADLMWSLLTLMLVIPQAVPLFPNVVHDRDYSIFVENLRLPLWTANSAIAAVALVNLAITAWVAKHFFLRIRAVRRLKTVQQTGAGRSDQETSPARSDSQPMK
ncbi:MAG: hypothetical protein ABSG04_05975 [Verrucomicrobiota bacterium]